MKLLPKITHNPFEKEILVDFFTLRLSLFLKPYFPPLSLRQFSEEMSDPASGSINGNH
jgi:hypothetical protein